MSNGEIKYSEEYIYVYIKNIHKVIEIELLKSKLWSYSSFTIVNDCNNKFLSMDYLTSYVGPSSNILNVRQTVTPLLIFEIFLTPFQISKDRQNMILQGTELVPQKFIITRT